MGTPPDTLWERLAQRPPGSARDRRGLPPWELRYVLETAHTTAAAALPSSYREGPAHELWADAVTFFIKHLKA
jgi:hypothetical protein